jgi:superfamily II DNA or RNA helicase
MDARRLPEKLRRALRRAADYRCVKCGADLWEAFHADHIEPFSVTGRTNVFEMQALCPKCNLEKGAKRMWTPRDHQLQTVRLCNSILDRTNPREITLGDVTPGGGKSSIPVIAANKLIGPVADKMIWVTPRIALQKQGERAFLDKDLLRFIFNDPTSADADILARAKKLMALVDPNKLGPAAGFDGYLTTFNSVRADPKEHLQYMRSRRVILIIDEPQFVLEGSPFHESLQPMVDAAVHTFLMSGTLTRGDRRPMAFLQYDPKTRKPIADRTPTMDYIKYSRRMALQEEAIVQFQFCQIDGNPAWDDEVGNRFAYDSLIDVPWEENSAALRTLTDHEKTFAFSLLDRMLADWQNYRLHDRQSRFIVVATDIRRAQIYCDYLRERIGDAVDIAVSYDTDGDVIAKQALRNIRRFQDGKLLGLVTVGMAYVGLDVPEATHLACLTVIRAKPWLEQMLARIGRVNYKNGLSWKEQIATAYVPKDPVMAVVIAEILAEQQKALRDEGGNGGNGGGPKTIDAIRADATAAEMFNAQTGERMGDPDLSVFQEAAEDAGLQGMNPFAVRDLFAAVARRQGQGGAPRPQAAPAAPSPRSPSEDVEYHRKELDRLVRSHAKAERDRTGNVDAYEHFGSKVKRRFGKRDTLTLDELKQAIAWVNEGGLER